MWPCFLIILEYYFGENIDELHFVRNREYHKEGNV